VDIKVTNMNFKPDFILVDIKDNVLDFEPVNERICKIWVKLQYYNVTYISTHASTEDKDVVVKVEFYISLEKVCDAVPHDMDNNTTGL
jgi:hypothetical protein